MNEIIRRVVLLVGAIVATVTFCLNSGTLIRVDVEQKVDPRMANLVQRPTLSEWQRVLERVTKSDDSSPRAFFQLSESPFPEYLSTLDQKKYAYGLVELPAAQGRVTLSIHLVEPGWVVRTAPTGIAFPHRWLSPWLLGATLVVYLLIPWPKRLGPDVWQYGLLTAGVIPDLFVALPLLIVTFGAPLLIVGANPQSGNLGELYDFREGWAFLTLAMWSLAAIAASIFWFTAWYTAYAVALRPASIWVRTVRGEREYRFDEIVAVRRSQVGLPQWARRMLWLAPLVSWKVLPSLIVAETTDTRALDLTLQDGEIFRLPIGALPGIEQLVQALENGACGCTVSKNTSLPSLAELRQPWATGGWLEIVRRAMLLSGCVLGAWAYLHTTSELIVIRPVTFETERARLADYFYVNNLNSLEDYLSRIVVEDPSRMTTVAGPEWEQLFADLDHSLASREAGALWKKGRGDGYVCFARPEAPEPLPRSIAGIERSLGPRYLILAEENRQRYLSIAHLDGPEIAYRSSLSGTVPPPGLLHPARRWTWVFLTPAFLAYLAIPWPRRLHNMVAAPMLGVIVEDILSCLFAIATVAWLVVLAIPYLQDATEAIVGDFLLFFGIAALGCLSTFAFAVDASRLAGVSIVVAADGFMCRCMRSVQNFGYQEITATKNMQLGPPAWIVFVVILTGLLIWPLLPVGLLLLRSRAKGLAMHFHGGRIVCVSKSLHRFELLERAIYKNHRKSEKTPPGAALTFP